MLQKRIVVNGNNMSFNGRVRPFMSFTEEGQDFYNSSGMYGVSMGMYGADGFNNFIGAVVPGIVAAKQIRKKRATKYAQDLDASLRAQYPESSIASVMSASIDGLKGELSRQKDLRSRAKSRGDKMKYDEGVEVVTDLLNYYQGVAAATAAQPAPKVVVETPPTGSTAYVQPLIGMPVPSSDPTLNTSILPRSGGGALQSPTTQAQMMAEQTPEEMPAKKKVSPWLLAGGAVLLIGGAYLAFRKK